MKKLLLITAIITIFLSCKKDSQDTKPIAVNAGADVTITLPMDSVTLGSALSASSIDKSLTYKWTQISGPQSVATIKSQTAAVTEVKNLDYYDRTQTGTDRPTDYTFELSVTNDKGISSKDTVTVSVIFGGCSVGSMEWRQSAGGLMYLQYPSVTGSESFSPCGAGLESNWSDNYDFFLKTTGGWTNLKYVNDQDKLTTTETIFMSSSYNADENVYSPALYAKQNSGIDFTQKGIGLVRSKH